MKIKVFFHVFIFVMLQSSLFAFQYEAPTGVGVADWGMSRNDIIAAEGPPVLVSSKGSITYTPKNIIGENDVGITYHFEQGCTKFNNSNCIFSDGEYTFHKNLKGLSEKIESLLTEKYGPPLKKEERIEKLPFICYSGKAIRKHIDYIRIANDVKIVHSELHNMYNYEGIDGLNKAGITHNTIHYYGPYFKNAEINKEKSKKRGI